MYQNRTIKNLDEMKIVKLERKGDGYSGICTGNFTRYYRFWISSGVFSLIPVKFPDAVDNFQQFSRLWEQYHPQSRFLEKPITVNKLTVEELSKVFPAAYGLPSKAGTA